MVTLVNLAAVSSSASPSGAMMGTIDLADQAGESRVGQVVSDG